jgi:hypothetical protein
MKKLSTKKLKAAHDLISGFHYENKGMVFDVPSLLQYCLEKDLRDTLKQKKYTDNDIDNIIRNSDFNVKPTKKGTNKVKFTFNYKNFEGFLKTYMKCDF